MASMADRPKVGVVEAIATASTIVAFLGALKQICPKLSGRGYKEKQSTVELLAKQVEGIIESGRQLPALVEKRVSELLEIAKSLLKRLETPRRSQIKDSVLHRNTLDKGIAELRNGIDDIVRTLTVQQLSTVSPYHAVAGSVQHYMAAPASGQPSPAVVMHIQSAVIVVSPEPVLPGIVQTPAFKPDNIQGPQYNQIAYQAAPVPSAPAFYSPVRYPSIACPPLGYPPAEYSPVDYPLANQLRDIP